MADIHSEKNLSPSGFNLYNGGAVNGKVPGTTLTGKIDQFQGWSRFHGAQLDEPRISSFSKQDTMSYGSAYKESFHGSNFKRDFQKQSTVSAGYENMTGNCMRNNSKSSCRSPEHVRGIVDSPASEARVLRTSGCGVPPLPGGSPSASRPGIGNNLNTGDHSNATSPELPAHERSSSIDVDGLNEEHRKTHRRQMSDVGSVSVDSLYNGEPRRNVSGEMSSSGSSTDGNTPRVGSDSSPYWTWSDSGRFSTKEISSWSTSSSGGSPSVLNLKVSGSPVADSPSPRASTSSSGGSSRGSSVAGSPTVGRTSSAGNSTSKSTGLAPSEVANTTCPASRSSHSNGGQLRGGFCKVGALSISGKSSYVF